MVGLWARSHRKARAELLEATGADLLATSLGQAVREIQESFESGTPATPLGSASRRIA